MKTYQFNTNIRCAACEAKVADVFSKEPRITNFRVDLADPKRPLDVIVTDDLSKEVVIKLIAEAGYEAEPKRGVFAALFGK